LFPFFSHLNQLEACLFLGVDSEDLYPKPFSFFVERAHNHSTHLAKVLAEHFETTRQGLVTEVKTERKRITAEVAKKAAALGATSTGMSLEELERQKIAEKTRQNIEAEKKRMESVKAKQEKEMQQSLEYELKMAEEAVKAQNKILQEQAEEAARKKKIEAARKKAIEEKRKEAERKREEEEERAAEQRRLTNLEYEEEAKKAKELADSGEGCLLCSS